MLVTSGARHRIKIRLGEESIVMFGLCCCGISCAFTVFVCSNVIKFESTFGIFKLDE